MKIAQLRSFFWSAFSRIQTEYSVPLRIQSESGKIRTRKNFVFEHFSRSVFFSAYYDEGYYEARLEQGSSDIY